MTEARAPRTEVWKGRVVMQRVIIYQFEPTMRHLRPPFLEEDTTPPAINMALYLTYADEIKIKVMPKSAEVRNVVLCCTNDMLKPVMLVLTVGLAT